MKRYLGWIGALALALSLLGPAPPARAQAQLVQATPPDEAVLGTAPARVDLVFDAALDEAGSRVRVYDAAGARVDRDDLQVDGKRMTLGLRDLAAGAYRVRWTAVVDGEQGGVRGDYRFRVGAASAGQPRLAVSPDHSDTGQLVTVAGGGFGAAALVLVAIGDEQRTLGAVRTDGQGRFALQTAVPDDLPHGRQVVQAVDLDGRMATAALAVERGGWPPLGATLSVESAGPNRLAVAVRLVNRSGWHLRRIEVRASVPPGARVLREGLEGPAGGEGAVVGGEIVWRGARAGAHSYVDAFAYVLDTAGVAPGALVQPTATISFEHGTPPLFRDQLTVGP